MTGDRFSLHHYADNAGKTNYNAHDMYQKPIVFLYPGSKEGINHIADIFPLDNAFDDFENVCRCFESLGVCAGLDDETCKLSHFKTKTFAHCWEYASGKCVRGKTVRP
eukprot:UN00863